MRSAGPPPHFRDQVLFQMVAGFGNLVVQVEHQLPAEPPKGQHSGASLWFVCPICPLYSHRASCGLHSAPSISFLLGANKDRHFHFVSAEALNSLRSRPSQELEQLGS